MTEEEWLACEDPSPMLISHGGKVSDRKLRLFALACCSRIARHILDARSSAAVVIAEQLVEVGILGSPELLVTAEAAATATAELWALCDSLLSHNDYLLAIVWSNAANAAQRVIEPHARHAAWWCAHSAAGAVGWSCYPSNGTTAQTGERAYQAALLRDVSGPLSGRAASLESAWLLCNNAAALDIARAVYEERAFDHLPILADALEEAGCGDDAILTHLRSAGPHVRGCWAVDLILSKDR